MNSATQPTPTPRAPSDGARFLASVEEGLRGALAGRLPSAARALAFAPAAKRVRPRLVLAFAAHTAVDEARLVRAATAVELVHLASLVHDDIVDTAETRRALPSVNAALGNARAVLVGDDLLCSALERVEPALLPAAVAAVRAMAAGALLEIEAHGDVALDCARWREIAAGKTGALFSLCGRAAAALAGDTAAAERRALAGRSLGVAFQAMDDVHDLESGQDLIERTPNLALALACERDDALASAVARFWALEHPGDGTVASLVARVATAGGVALARQVAAASLVEARDALGTDAALPPIADLLGFAGGWISRGAP